MDLGNVDDNGPPPAADRRRRQLLPQIPAQQSAHQGGRSRSPRSPRSAAAQVPIQPLDALIDNELGRYLPSAVLKDIRKQSLDLSSKIRGLQKTNVRRDKLKENIAMIQDGNLPTGFRPCSNTFETHLLDELVAQDGISAPVDTSLSIRDTKRKFHMEHLKVQLELDLQLLAMHRAHLKKHVSKESFLDRCLAQFPAWSHTHKSAAKYLDLEDSDNDDPTNLELRGLSLEQAQAKILAIYRKVVDAEVEIKRQEEDRLTAQKKQQQEVVQQLITKSPEDFLIEAIDSRIAQSKAKPKPKTSRKQRFEMNSAGLACQAMSGAMDADSIAGLVQIRPTEKGLGKGKGKSIGAVHASQKGLPKGKEPQAKGKGKGKLAKGKGKGKNKGKHPAVDTALPKNEVAPRKGGGKTYSKGKGQTAPRTKGRGKKGGGRDFLTGSGRGRWQ